MSYRFVQAAVDDGRARGPRLALVVHMAQGGGTVEFLSKPNRDGVSVHYVIRYTGEIVQMLDESHMHTSIRTSAIRTTEDPDGFYGRTEVVLAMGTWADTRLTLGPNHASLAVEIEGFAADGPNKAQQDSLERLVTDIRTRFPAIALLGHRDFQDYKACPGHLIPWDRLGGHGKGDMGLHITYATTGPVTGSLVIPPKTKALRVADGTSTRRRTRPRRPATPRRP
jgi:N-acetyl-anhydromuramyl-L-alanine amidase AmpD